MVSNSSTTPANALVRLIWMMAGPVVLMLLGFNLARGSHGWFSNSSIAFLICLGIVTIARRIDPNDGEGAPVDTAQRSRVAVGIFVVGIIVWAAANICGTMLAAD